MYIYIYIRLIHRTTYYSWLHPKWRPCCRWFALFYTLLLLYIFRSAPAKGLRAAAAPGSRWRFSGSLLKMNSVRRPTARTYRVNCTLPTTLRHSHTQPLRNTYRANRVRVLSNSQCSVFRISPEHWRGHASALCSPRPSRRPKPFSRLEYISNTYLRPARLSAIL